MKLVVYSDSDVPIHRVKELIACTVGSPTEERLNRILHEIYSQSNSSLYVSVDGNDAVGVIGIKRTGPTTAEILHIAVDEALRKQGIGRKMIDELLMLEDINELVAETDLDAVNFYRRYGFTVNSLGEKYPGVERFLCTLKS